MLAKILGVIGRLMIGAGVLILLFVAYQLWGTGLQTQAAQNDLRTEFDQQLAEARAQADAAGSTTTSTTTEPVAPVSTLPDGTAENPGDLGRPAEEADLGIQWGDPIGRILIDKIGVDFVYIEGVELSLLQDGPGHFPETSFPGQPGNAALAGHRTTFMAPFNRIDELSAGDLVQVETVQGTFTYEVMAQPDGLGHRIVGPDAIEITEDKGDDRLTLMACHPKYSAAQRIVVEAKL
ncbi:MAG: class E sortase, partial [Acidimicrobiales bacterium]|nr:class E sortase [Acidimicrobiales bacterium]